MSKTDQILELLAAGVSREEIARQLNTTKGSIAVLLWKRRHREANADQAWAWRQNNPEASRACSDRYRAKRAQRVAV